MPLLREDAQTILTPAEAYALTVEPALKLSIAAQLCTVHKIDSPALRVPSVLTDPTAEWLDEAQEFPMDDPTFGEDVYRPEKLGLISGLSEELARDSSPAAEGLIGVSLGRAVATALDAAFLNGAEVGVTDDPALVPGLATTLGISPVVTTLGALIPEGLLDAMSNAEQRGVDVNAWLMAPATKTKLLGQTIALAHAAPLLGVGPLGSQTTLLGRRVVTHPSVPLNTIYGIPTDRVLMVVRDGAELATDRSVFFTSWRIAVRIVMRATYAFLDPAAITKVTWPA